MRMSGVNLFFDIRNDFHKFLRNDGILLFWNKYMFSVVWEIIENSDFLIRVQFFHYALRVLLWTKCSNIYN